MFIVHTMPRHWVYLKMGLPGAYSQLLIKRSRLAQMLGMGCTMLRELHTQGHPNCDPDFPKPIRVTSNGSAFYLMSEVHAWIDSRTRKRDSELV